MPFPPPKRIKRYASALLRWFLMTFVVFVITLWAGKYITENYIPNPDKLFCFEVSVLAAGLISVVAGCFVELILLFVRAAEGEHS